jgi:hypothetical protein
MQVLERTEGHKKTLAVNTDISLRKLGVDGTIIMRRSFKEHGVRLWTGIAWFRFVSNGGLL